MQLLDIWKMCVTPAYFEKVCNGYAVKQMRFLCEYSRAPVSTDSVSAVYRGPKKMEIK
jgi:hypothetical protein